MYSGANISLEASNMALKLIGTLYVPLVYTSTGCPQKNQIKPLFKFLTLGGGFLRVKDNSKNCGNKKQAKNGL